MGASGQCSAKDKSKIFKEGALPDGLDENNTEKGDNSKYAQGVDICRKQDEVAGEKDSGFVFQRKIEEGNAEEDEYEHFQIGSGSQEERIVENDFYEREVRQDEDQKNFLIHNRLEYFIDKVQKAEKNHELEEDKIQIVVCGPYQVINKSHAEILQGSVVPAGVEEKKRRCFGIPDLEGLERLLCIIRWENHPIRMRIEGDTNENDESNAEDDE